MKASKTLKGFHSISENKAAAAFRTARSQVPARRSRDRSDLVQTKAEGVEDREHPKATSCLPNCFPKAPSWTEMQTCLASGTLPFNFQIDVYFKGHLIPVALNYVQ